MRNLYAPSSANGIAFALSFPVASEEQILSASWAGRGEFPSQMTPKTQRARFQFELRDLLFVTALTFLGMCVFLPMDRYGYEFQMRWWKPPAFDYARILRDVLVILLANIAGNFVGQRLAQKWFYYGLRRILFCFLGCFATWGILYFYFIANDLRRRPSGGRGEWCAIAACKTYQESQDIYHSTDWDHDGVLEYAQSISGANSLYELTPGTGNLTLVDSAMACASVPNGRPKGGYLFKVLKAQGPHASGGRMSYLEPKPDGTGCDMIKGYALVAWPSPYSEDLAPTLIINQKGTVYYKDIGPDTAKIVKQMTEYDPDETWEVAP